MEIKCKHIIGVVPSEDGENLFLEVSGIENYEDIINSLCIQFGTNTIRKCLED